MFVLVLAAEADETRQTVTFLIVCLVGIAAALALLTVWYWFYTSPKRRQELPVAGSELLEQTAEPDVESLDDAGAGDETGSEDDAAPVSPGEQDGGQGEEEFVIGPVLARQTWDFVAAAKRAEERPPNDERSPRVAAPRIEVPERTAGNDPDDDGADELAVARRRREREAARGLSDEVWDSVRRSAFDKLDR